MNDNFISELESAAAIIMAPPNLVSNEQRHNAEAIFLNFRKCKTPFVMCREILDKCQVHYVLFEAAETIKSALIREWSFLSDSDKYSLRQYLMHYISTKQVPSFVRDRIIQVIAIMVKRASVDDGGRERGTILQEVESIILNAEPEKKILGFNIIANLMQEYASTVKSTDVGLPWEVHFKAKKQFESTDLKRIFQFCVQLLSEVVKNDPPYPDNVLELTRHILKVTESVLTWGYMSPLFPKRLIGIYESVYEADHAPSLKLSDNWSEIILSPQLLPLMFQIFWKVREYDGLSHHALTCLVQLASLNGGVLSSDAVRLEYLKSYMVNFTNLVSSVTIKNKESLGISNIVKKLILFFIGDIQKLTSQLQDSYLDELTRLTCSFCKGAALEDMSSDEEKYYNDSFDNMMEAWTNILQEYGVNSNGSIQECAVQIFNTYIQYHLGPPDGARQNHDVHEIEDNEDIDRISFKDQLQTIGMFGRIVPGHALPIIYKLLEVNTEKLKISLQLMESRAMNMNESSNLDNLFEDIHWVILIAGHILCMDSDGETPMIPSEMMQYSIEQLRQNNSTLESSLTVLASAHQITNVPTDVDRCDHIIRIVSDVLKLCVVENSAAEAKLGHFMSPEVSSTIMWFLKRWCLSYLLPVENYYQEISPVLIGAVGKDTEGAIFVVNFILDKIYSNICHFNSEPILLRDTVDLLTALVCIKQKQSLCIVKSKSLWNLITLQEKLTPGRLPSTIHRELFKSFILAGMALRDMQELNGYFDQILRPLHTRFDRFINQEDNFRANYHKEEVQKEIIDILESFIGIAKGSHMSTVQILFQFLAPRLAELPKILTFYNNYQVIVQLILELFGQCAKNMLCYLCQLDSKKLYESTLATVQAYAKCNGNKFSGETLAEENSFQDLALILDLLTFILSKDCIDLCPNDEEVVTVTASDVSLFGLNFIMPLMTLDLLKYPSLCSQYYRLLVLINDIYPEKICNLPPTLFQQLLSSIELGLTQFSSDIAQACLDFIQGMTWYFFRNSLQQNPFCQAMKPFLKMLLDLTLSHQINSDLMSSASTCIYALICCYEEEYTILVDGLIKSQADPLIADRLAAAFHNLTLNVAMIGGRQPKLKFRDNFDKFIANVQGFLLVK
ncbi:exportin-4 [Tribolium castaneum]|uniref:Exportin-4 n=1 Tax=Tribolium castaneum TaxID=7070 RepID=A0A139W8Z2_TRICA|nr:PREDICTED: exportin-4 isoform X1 [Tribolium castaneum]XP_015840265.1 PREDICTED: exportin-4 isoform X1 [Tribolium castaneum]KXZ75751.1 Exportin-4-like Protein [Tribolium castaneum]|eukprot:XP_008197770.1 PREDICTED: exportin-4 isoform X1 [Tribolium castaneum]